VELVNNRIAVAVCASGNCPCAFSDSGCSLIDFLEWAREVVKRDEGTKLHMLNQPETEEFELQVVDEKESSIRRVVLGSHTYQV
jgi:hypothetical protein